MNTNQIGVIVIGGHVQGLGIIKSLAKYGIPIYLIDNRQLCLGRFSKYCKKFFHFSEVNDKDALTEYVLKLEKKEKSGKWLLMPTTDGVVATLSQNKTKLEEQFLVPVPKWEVIKYAYNKILTYKIAGELGIQIPNTFYPKNIQDVRELSASLVFPAIIKPAVMHKFYSKTKRKVIVVQNKDDLLKTYPRICQIIDPSEVMIQEIIPGSPASLYSFCSFFKNGEAIASCTARRTRQIPMDFGKASTFVESVNIPELEALSVKLLSAIEYYGLSEVEFKWDSRDGVYKLLEINPRTWKWHTLALRGGINLPFMLYEDMCGKMVARATRMKMNVKWVDFYTDAYIVVREILRGRMSLTQYINSIRGECEFAVASHDDPWPFIVETILLPYLLIVR